MDRLILKRKTLGVALVEFALLLPILVALFLGTLEFGWAIYIQNVLSDAARQGARVASTDSVTVSDILSTVDTVVTNSKLSTASLSVDVNPANVSAQAKGTPITVTVSLPYTSVSILPTTLFLTSVTLQSEVTMNKEY